MSKIYCTNCSRQITNNGVSNEYECPTPMIAMGPTLGFICADCSKDLDENGLFPEERSNEY